MENNEPSQLKAPLMNKEDLTLFYKKRLPALIKTLFTKPVEGTRQLFENTGDDAYKNSMMLILSVMVLYLITPYFLAGSELRELVTFSVLIKACLIAGLFMVLVSLLSFGIKMFGGKPVFKKELLTGACCGIGLVLMLLVVVLAKLFIGELSLYDLMSPAGMIGKMQYLFLLNLYVLLFMVNIFQQSLRAGGVSEAGSWYLAPLSVLLCFYLTFKISSIFF
ncbi:hypothetical protein [Mucilaginibacter celer]|uniref:Yip1 domain-containing protein n=1 Tax=Mucilaginibacter celer TaxID=2305508 RepID=A0A494VQQ7_9SPHI|nr:hypothetical protein [Mucilaginibacter celer]AYL95620.1 hypothetical protein HYN43_010095 [Mucilaginibacter celer]